MNDDKPFYEMRLFITGATPNSLRAMNNLRSICEKYFPGKYSLEIVDIYQEPSLARKEQIIAVPMLLKSSPLPVKRLIGDMSETNKVLKALDYEL